MTLPSFLGRVHGFGMDFSRGCMAWHGLLCEYMAFACLFLEGAWLWHGFLWRVHGLTWLSMEGAWLCVVFSRGCMAYWVVKGFDMAFFRGCMALHVFLWCRH